MKNTLHSFFIIIFLLSGINSFAENKSNEYFACPTASISYASIKFCNSDSTIKAVNLTGTDAYLGGTFTSAPVGLNLNSASGSITPSSSTPGFYTITYTIPSGPGCPSTDVTTTVEIVEQVNAGTDGTIYVCENNTTPIDLFSIITGEQAGGVWVRTSGSGGTFNAVAGTLTLSPGITTTSTFEYILTTSAPCSNDSSVATVIIGSLPTGISISGSTAICVGNSATLTIIGTPNTVVTLTDGGVPMTIILDGSGNATITVSPTVTTTYNLTSASLNSCTIPLSQSATVTVNATPQFITQIPDITICNGGMLNIASQLTTTVPGTSFIWSATTSNVNMSAISGDHTNIDQIVNLINALQTGTISIQVRPQVGSCYGTIQEILVTVKPIPAITSTTANQTVICNNEFVSITANSNPMATSYNWQINTANNVQIVGGTTNGTSVTGIIDLQLSLSSPFTAGTISFNLTPVNGICTGATIMNAVTIIVNPQADAGLDGMTSVSETSTTPVDLFSLITGEQAGGTWTQTSGTGGTFNAATGTFTPAIGATTSTFVYTLTGTAPCINDISVATINIDAVPIGIPNTSNQTISNGSFSSIMLSSSNVPSANFTWTFISNNISGASNGSGTTISQQLSLIDPNLDGYVDYTITPVNNSASGSSFVARVSIQNVLSSESFIVNTIKLSPNPVTDILNIENEFQINSIQIYNQLGQMIFGKEINNNTTQLDLSVINSGIYNVLIETEKGTVNHKIVKK